MARWSREGRAAYEAEREALLYVFFLFLFFDRCKVFQSDRKIFHEGAGIFFLFDFFGFIFIVFAVLLCRAVLSLSYCSSTYSKHSKRGKGSPDLGYVYTYVRHVSERRGRRTSGNRTATRSVCGVRAVFS